MRLSLWYGDKFVRKFLYLDLLSKGTNYEKSWNCYVSLVLGENVS